MKDGTADCSECLHGCPRRATSLPSAAAVDQSGREVLAGADVGILSVTSSESCSGPFAVGIACLIPVYHTIQQQDPGG